MKQDYGASAKTSNTKQAEDDHQPLAQLFQVKHQTVGPRLLRRLGWREGGSIAYVARVKGDDDDPQDASQEERTRVLSTKKLRKIQLLATRIPLPPPKLDQCGLGFEPHQDAPEFRRHRERRKKLAQERARGSSNVYRASQLTNDGSAPESAARNTGDDPYVSYETIDDFVGQKSVGGFALREDDDDAYDDAAPSGKDSKIQVSREEYNMEVYEHSSDDDQQHMHAASSNPKKDNAAADFGGVLASWAKTTSTTEDESKPNGGLTTDGRPPLAGFVLGGSVQSHIQRYPGPDVPLSYQVKRHVFGENEHPLIFQTMSRSVQLEAEDQRRQVAFHEALQANKQRSKETKSSGPMAGSRFDHLQLAMKSRFTSASATNKETTTPIGLHVPDATAKLQAAPDEKTRENQPKKEISITRTMHMFSPHPLVCKRFHVPVPKHASKIPVEEGRQNESTYFRKEIMAGVSDARATPTSLEKAVAANAQPGVSRPPMETLKAIFEPETESSDSEDEVEEEAGSEKEPEQADNFQQNLVEAASVAVVVHAAEPNDAPNPDSQLVVFEPDESQEKRLRSDRRRSRKRRSRSSSSDSSNEERRSKNRRKRRSRPESSDSSSDESRSKRKKKERRRDRKRHEKKSRKSKSSKKKRH